MTLDPFPFSHRWPALPTSPELSVRDVGLVDLARHAAMRAAFPLGTIKADTDDLWNVLKARADDLGPDLDRDATLTALEPGAHEWATARAAERRSAETEEA